MSLYAPARCYGRPNELRALVDAAHQRGIAVVLDVVYNHFGPDGECMCDFRHIVVCVSMYICMYVCRSCAGCGIQSLWPRW